MIPPIAAPFPPPAMAPMMAPTAVGNARALDRLRSLVAALRASFVVNLDCVAIEQSHIPRTPENL
jgi:hypothetical protein